MSWPLTILKRNIGKSNDLFHPYWYVTKTSWRPCHRSTLEVTCYLNNCNLADVKSILPLEKLWLCAKSTFEGKRAPWSCYCDGIFRPAFQQSRRRRRTCRTGELRPCLDWKVWPGSLFLGIGASYKMTRSIWYTTTVTHDLQLEIDEKLHLVMHRCEWSCKSEFAEWY